MKKILLYYKYVKIQYPEQIIKWQKALCQELNLKGRIIIAHEGINGTVSGTEQATQAYKNTMNQHELFDGIDFKESTGNGESFPRMRVVLRKEIVHLGVDPEQITAGNGGTHLTPAQAHALIAQKPKNLVLLDCRNKCESDVGTFQGSIKPNTRYFREFPHYINTHADQFKGKQVVMFCTGGIRCERASAYVKQHTDAQEVYQIEGGIHRYVEQFPDGFFRGKNYVFDGRVTVKVNNDILGICALCNTPEDTYINCANALCNKHMICCAPCIALYKNSCSTQCKQLIEEHAAPVRPPLHQPSEHA